MMKSITKYIDMHNVILIITDYCDEYYLYRYIKKKNLYVQKKKIIELKFGILNILMIINQN